MHILIETNPNCVGSEEYVFNALETPRKIRGIRIAERGKEVDCDVIGVGLNGEFGDAWAAKIADSGAGFAFIIYGGDWGIRVRSASAANEAWDLSNTNQWGEPFKIYGSEEDIIYE